MRETLLGKRGRAALLLLGMLAGTVLVLIVYAVVMSAQRTEQIRSTQLEGTPTGKRLLAASDRAAVDAAIRKLAATGRPFSANDARALPGVKGGVVGAAFTAANKSGLIRPVGDETSTDTGTHGHRIYQWIGTAA